MNAYYPICLHITGKLVVIIGGGKIAERKIKNLYDTGARIEVVSPDLTSELQKMVEMQQIVWKRKAFSIEDIDNALMVIAATNDPAVNRMVKTYANNSQLISLVDDHENSDFHIPSVLRRGRLTFAISTSGASPILAKKIKNKLEQDFDDRYDDYLEFLHRARRTILRTIQEPDKKKGLLTAIVSDYFLESDNREAEFQALLEQEMGNI
ncbi:NAD(P)-binding protein [Neobacillus sp. LXY-4]|uniref:NAD(P)-binding protein n=1 Tax=Neobacillus sp. LXY-4 TaxID=3379826 RepID=UPI003EDF4845